MESTKVVLKKTKAYRMSNNGPRAAFFELLARLIIYLGGGGNQAEGVRFLRPGWIDLVCDILLFANRYRIRRTRERLIRRIKLQIIKERRRIWRMMQEEKGGNCDQCYDVVPLKANMGWGL